jgi:hypothetical protein
VSYGDGWPSYRVEVEHLPDRTYRLWLRDGTTRADLGTLADSRGCYPVVKDRVRTHLALPDDDFLVELAVPRPPWVRIGGRVTVRTDDGRELPGVVTMWVQGEALVETSDPADSGSALYPLEDLTVPGESGG